MRLADKCQVSLLRGHDLQVKGFIFDDDDPEWLHPISEMKTL